MRGGLERWKRGTESRGLRQAVAYAMDGVCDAHLQQTPTGVTAADEYSAVAGTSVERFIVEDGSVTSDRLSADALRVWLAGHDPVTGEERGRPHLRAESDLLLDATLNHPKSYSIAALLHPELAIAFEALQDRIRDRTLVLWQQELNARRGHGGFIREDIARLEVVELQHRRSRALDPHIHRHLWLNVKVRGLDGQWTNVDSRVAMKFHTLVNAEGELAARTDPEWVAALARHGYTIGPDGEIAELAAVVAPLSRRSAQIEANRARLIADWRNAHGSTAPSVTVLQQIDRRAWALARPNKPPLLDEASWEHAVRDELRTVHPTVDRARPAAAINSCPVEELDIELLAASAVVDADDRSRSSSGRFSYYDVRAGALRALSRAGAISDRAALDPLVHDIVSRAFALIVRLTDEQDVPGHVKQYIASETMRTKVRLAHTLDGIAAPGLSARPDQLLAADSPHGRGELDTSQVDAACAIAGKAGLVTVTGPAGAGKTTMLRIAHVALRAQRRRMLVVAPTRKAASVAAREIGAPASSIHALLHDHGFRWGHDTAGAEVWTRLTPGDIDPATASRYGGPVHHRLRARDRIVVDEAGMMDLHTALALATLALATRTTVALVGDPHQATPVGHTGAMAMAIRATSTAIELDTVHRFRDPTYAALTLQLRNPRDHDHARQIAQTLLGRGHVTRVDSTDDARAAMVDGYFHARSHGHSVAVVCGTNSEADTLNTLIQQRRTTAGELDPRTLAWGRGEQRLMEGDTVQTRRNDRASGVENRATWIIHRIHPDRIDLISPTDAGEHRWITHDYASNHLHLAYASTVHGIQGDTTHTSIVGPDVTAAGLYVGLTRGRHHNTAVVIAHTNTAATDTLAATMTRGTTETSIDQSTNAVDAELRRAARGRTDPTVMNETRGIARSVSR
ncbi:AAA family ATPase [Microbacterium sp. 1P10UB]|uniref:AAA family ATPase n=1 Tax=unclassified Microbacterium TaxID=2609290 RepID=UPI0039A11A1F